MPTSEARDVARGVTAPHLRHTWRWRARRTAFVCERCDALVPERIVAAADLRADMGDLPLDALLDRLATTRITATPGARR